MTWHRSIPASIVDTGTGINLVVSNLPPVVAMFLIGSVTGIPIIFGYAKPLPVDFGKLRNPKRDMLWVALAGLVCNFLMALVWLLLAMTFKRVQFGEEFFLRMVGAGVTSNLILIAFYLIPLPP